MGENLINIGKITSAHGIKGEIKVLPYSDIPERCYRLENVRIIEDGEVKVYEVENARLHDRNWVIKLKNTDNRDDADKFKGSYIYLLPEEREPLPPGHYYWDVIIGLEVYAEDSSYLGVIEEIIPSGGHDIYAVNKEGYNKPLLIPAVKDIVQEIELHQGRVQVTLPAGLDEL